MDTTQEPQGVPADSGAAEVVVAPSDGAEPSPAAPEDAPTDGRRWFVIHTYSGYENKVKANIEKRVTSMSMEDRIFRILVPEEEQMELTKEGKRKTVKRKIYPGYVLVELILDDDSWYVVRNTPGVTGFVASGNRPLPLRPDEMDGILAQMGMGQERPRPKMDLEAGQNIRVRTGPFDGFIGVIDAVDDERGKIKVLVSMFGRETPLELDFTQVEKI